MTPTMLLALVVWIAAGWAAVSLLVGPSLRAWIGPAGRAGLALGVGMGLTALGQFWADAVGIGIHWWIPLAVAATLVVPAGAAWWRRRSAAPPPADTRRGDDTSPYSPLERLALVAILAAVSLVLVKAMTTPVQAGDARAMWTLKAKMIRHHGLILTEEFCDPDRVHPHARYPLMLPLAQVNLWLWNGQSIPWDEWSVKVLVPLCFAALMLVVFDAIAIAAGRRVALILTALLAWTPLFSLDSDILPGLATSVLADVPLALYHTAATVWLIVWLRTGQVRAAVVAGVLTALAIFTKNEGLALAAINLACAGALMVVSRDVPFRARVMGWLVVAGLAIGISVPWLLEVSSLSATFDDNSVLAQLVAGQFHWDRVPTVLEAMILQAVHADRWSVLWLLAAVALIASWRSLQSVEMAVPALGIALYLALLVVVYSLHSLPAEYMVRTTLPRVLVNVAPLTVCLVGFAFAARSEAATELPEPHLAGGAACSPASGPAARQL